MTLEEFIAAIEDHIPALDAINHGEWNEYTGSLLLTEDQWGAIKSARDELRTTMEKAKPLFADLVAREAAE